MANEQQLEILRQGSEVWNKWRLEYPEVKVDLREANLEGAYLADVNLCKTDLEGANLSNSNLERANLNNVNLYLAELIGARLNDSSLLNSNLLATNFKSAKLINADLRNSYLREASFSGADLSGADLSQTFLKDSQFFATKLIRTRFKEADLRYAFFHTADLSGADLTKADLSGADFSNTNLQFATLVETNLEHTKMNYCSIYGISVWGIKGKPSAQLGIVITPPNEPEIKVDDLQVAQFIYLLLNRENLRNVLDTLTSKAVLILGRFTQERKEILEAMADELRKNNLIPIIFDFERPSSKDFTETIKTLAGLSLFIIADITNPSSAPLELQATVPDYQIPFVPIIQHGEKPFAMLSDLIGKYNWVLQPVLTYQSLDKLLAAFKPAIIDRAWQKHVELQKQKIAAIETMSIDLYLENGNN